MTIRDLKIIALSVATGNAVLTMLIASLVQTDIAALVCALVIVFNGIYMVGYLTHLDQIESEDDG